MTVPLDREAAGRYVLSRLTPGGGSSHRTPQWGVEEPDAPDTLAALESLRILGLGIPEPEATGRWLASQQSVDGDYPTLTIGWVVLRSLALLDITPLLSPAAWLGERAAALAPPGGGARERRGALRDALHLLELFELPRVVGTPPTRPE